MATPKDDLFRKALHLTEGERADLAGMLLESIEPAPDPGVEQLWLAEVERRMEQLDSGQVQSIPWEQVRTRLHSQLNE